MCIAMVDDGGNLMLFQRIDGTQIGSADVAIGKARTAIAFRRPPGVRGPRPGGWVPMLGLPGGACRGRRAAGLAGQMVGAIGVSGGLPAQDGQVALAGASALAGEG